MTTSDFRRLSDWYGFCDLQRRLPGLKQQFEEKKAARLKLKAKIEAFEGTAKVDPYTGKKQRVPQHLEDSYNEAAWAWQRAYAAYVQARKYYQQLCRQYPEWSEDNGHG